MAATSELATPEFRHRHIELFKAVEVVRNTVVTLPTANHAPQPATGLSQGVMATTTELLLDHHQGPTHP